MNPDSTNNNSSNNLKVWTPLLLSLTMVVGMLIGFKLQDAEPAMIIKADKVLTGPEVGEYDRIEEIIKYVEAKYVDDIEKDLLIEMAVENLLKELDPHSNYISKEELQVINEQLDGSFEGIGVEFMVIDDTIVVVDPLDGGPSDIAGIMPGDKIVQIEDSIVAGLGYKTDQIVDRLKGQKGTEVKVGIKRGAESDIRFFDIIRDRIPLKSVDAGYLLESEIGYIKVSRFSANTYREFMEELDVLVEKKNMKHLVIDLRQNPGGYLNEATKILSQLFEEKDKLLVYTEGDHVRRNEYESTGKNFFDIDNIAVLIDEGSASASEIVAGALQDWDRGVLVGRRTFGKGLVQEQYRLRDGSALRLTVARYYTPSGRSIQKAYDDLDIYEKDYIDRMSNGELINKDSIEILDTTKFYTSAGRVVYGGGGIVPDIFVPIDTAWLNPDYIKLRQFVPEFIYRWANQPVVPDFQTLADLERDFQVMDEDVDALIRFAKEKGMEGNVNLPAYVNKDLKVYMKARMARHFFQDKGFFQIWNTSDPVVMKAVEALKRANPITNK